MKKIRITVMKQTCYDDLIEKYENQSEHSCDMKIGQEFIAEGCNKPDGLCNSAWDSMSAFVMALSYGAEDIYDGWMKNKHSAMISCNDGFRPVSFLLETIEEKEEAQEISEINNQGQEQVKDIYDLNLDSQEQEQTQVVYDLNLEKQEQEQTQVVQEQVQDNQEQEQTQVVQEQVQDQDEIALKYSDKLNGFWEEGYHYYLEFRDEKLTVRNYRREISLETVVSYDAKKLESGERTVISLEDTVLSRTFDGHMMTEIKELAYENGEIHFLYNYTLMGETLYILKKTERGPFDHIIIRDDEYMDFLQGKWEEISISGKSTNPLYINGNKLFWISIEKTFHVVSYKYDPESVYIVPENLIDTDFSAFAKIQVYPDKLTTRLMISDMSMPLTVFARKEMMDKIEIPEAAKESPRNTMTIDEPEKNTIKSKSMTDVQNNQEITKMPIINNEETRILNKPEPPVKNEPAEKTTEINTKPISRPQPPINQQQSPINNNGPQPPVNQQQPVARKVLFCRNCGFKLPEGKVSFCPECGSKIF